MLVVVRLDRVDDAFGLAVATRELARDQSVRSVHLVTHGLADVVEQRGSLGRLHASLQLGGHDPAQVDDLERVLEDVLPVARAIPQATEDAHELLVELAAVRLEDGLLAGLQHVLLELGLRLVVHLLDPRGMDAPVLDELLERQPGDLAAQRVE